MEAAETEGQRYRRKLGRKDKAVARSVKTERNCLKQRKETRLIA